MKKTNKFIFLTFVITVLLSLPVMASTSNSVSKKVTVEPGCPIGSEYADDVVITSGSGYNPVYLKITPQTGIDADSSIIISIENGVFMPDIYPMPEYKSPLGNSYDQILQAYNNGAELKQLLKENLGAASCELPYKITNTSPYEIQVELFPVPESECDKTNNAIAYDRVYYYIPIHAMAENVGSVRITIDDNESNVTGGGSYTIAKAEYSSLLSGDADGSGVLTSNDCAQLLAKSLNYSYITGLEALYPNSAFVFMDANGDGEITASDAALVLSKILNKSAAFTSEGWTDLIAID